VAKFRQFDRLGSH